MIERPYYPIVYVRGYAGSRGSVEDTVSTPYMGFNLGSTKYRRALDGEMQPWVFESPLIRLMKDHEYVDAYRNGALRPDIALDPKSVWIFRYYDVASKDFGDGDRREIFEYAEMLRDYLLDIRKNVCDGAADRRRFRVYLVAHSMGGLICRCYLQNSKIPNLNGSRPGSGAKKGVDKLFTYATPHGGIEFRKGLGWAEGLRDFLDVNNQGNFGEARMRKFLALRKGVDLRSLNNQFPAEKVFCVVGTDARDYGAAGGWSRRSVGPVSDGLVQIRNAYVKGSSRSFTYRSHSGHYGIVNSESAYQNLERFLFGDTRIQIDLHMDRVDIPDLGKSRVEATYQIEMTAAIRGLPVAVSRRLMREESATFLKHADLEGKDETLFTTFLDRKKILGARRRTMGFSLKLRIVPEYHVNKKWRRDDHFEGHALFDDTVILLANLHEDGTYTVSYGWLSSTSKPTKKLELAKKRNGLLGEIEVERRSSPAASGRLLIRVSRWNDR